MEIIEQGNPKIDTRVYQYKCKCGCRFNATYPNDYKEYGFDADSLYMMVACPVCGRPYMRGLIAELRYYFNSESMSDLL